MQHAPLLQDLDLPRPAERLLPRQLTSNLPVEEFFMDEPSSFSTPWDSTGIDDKNEFCSVGLQEFPVFINEDLTIQLLQAPTAFRGVQHDETGTVVWGASICLARFLSPNLVKDRTVLELGCGCGLPSLVVAHYGTIRVSASDMEDATLQQLDQNARLNRLNGDRLELVKLNWKDHDATELEPAELILASDVIYHPDMVGPLVKTIDRYLAKGGRAYLALRNTRQGVSTFWQEAMPAAGFQVVETISCREYLQDNDHTSNDANRHRFRGDHSIYVFQKVGELI